MFCEGGGFFEGSRSEVIARCGGWRFQVSSFKFEVSGLRFQVSSFWFQVFVVGLFIHYHQQGITSRNFVML